MFGMKSIRTWITIFESLLVLMLGWTCAVWAYETEDCVACHNLESSQSKLKIDIQMFKRSVHGGDLECMDCHSRVADESHIKQVGSGAVDCSGCHEQHNRYGLKTHPKADLGGDHSLNRCIGCHQGQGAHGEKKPVNAATCWRCHLTGQGKNDQLGFIDAQADLAEHPGVFTLALFYQIIMPVLALAVLVAGIARRRRLIKIKRTKKERPDWAGWFGAVFVQKRLQARPLVGSAHLYLTWGFVIFVVVVLAAQMPLRLSATAAAIVSMILDMAGILMLAATVFLLVRRLVRKLAHKDLRPPKRTILPLLLLLVILLSGLLTEGARLNLVAPGHFWEAPAGLLFALVAPAAPAFMQTMLRVHFIFVMLFIATLPFTFMRHLAATSAHLLFKDRKPPQLPTDLDLKKGPLGAATVMDLSVMQLRAAEACVNCGRCDEQCPALLSGKPLSPRLIMGRIVDQMEAYPAGGRADGTKDLPRLADTISADEIWACTTCMACVTHCPADIRPMDAIIQLRRNWVLREGHMPEEAVAMIRNLELYDDVYGKGPAHRGDWALGRNVPQAAESIKPDVMLLWVGCSGAFHPDSQQAVQGLTKLLWAAGVDFAVLGPEESCCGDPARKLGDEALYLKLARQNIARFKVNGVTKIVTLCPHCFDTLKNAYPSLGCDLEVVPAAALVAQLINEKRIDLKYRFDKSLAMHDPCYLGRYNGIYEPLRQVCRAVPGVILKELKRCKDIGFCCGGGGGRMWLHESLGEKINLLRAREVAAAGVDAVVTACPYCQTMLEDGLRTLDGENRPQIIDIIRLAADAIE